MGRIPRARGAHLEETIRKLIMNLNRRSSLFLSTLKSENVEDLLKSSLRHRVL